MELLTAPRKNMQLPQGHPSLCELATRLVGIAVRHC